MATTMMHESAKRGYTDQIQELADSGQKKLIFKTDSSGNVPLHWSTSGGHREATELLISLGSDVNVQNQFGDTPLHRAAWKGHAAICELLVKKGAAKSRDIKNKDEKTPFDLARTFEVKRFVAPPIETGPDEEFDQEEVDSD